MAEFERDLLSKGVPSFLADHSVEHPPLTHPLIHFERKHIGTRNDEKHMRFDTWVHERSPPEGDLILQMDIEGAEYVVILDTDYRTLERFRIIVVEFHFLDRLFDRFAGKVISEVFTKLCKSFVVVHIHPNNRCGSIQSGGIEIPACMEFTFLRADRVRQIKPATVFPHPLDRHNVNGFPEIKLPGCWYRDRP